MSGHNKWSKIKRKKEKLDKQRSKIFTRFSKAITTATKEGGADVAHNVSLKIIIDQSKSINIPKRVIDRAIKRAIGKGDNGQNFNKILYEAHCPNGIPLLISAVTDNKHRTVAEVRNILNDHQGHLGKAGSVTWQFNKKGKIELKPVKFVLSKKFGQKYIEQKDPINEVIMKILEIPAIEDILEKEINSQTYLDIIVPFNKLQVLNTLIRKTDYLIINKGVHYIYNNALQFSKKQFGKINNLVDNLYKIEDIQELWFPSTTNN